MVLQIKIQRLLKNKPVVDPTRAGAANPTLTDGTNYAHIDQFGEIENANLHVAGWHIANYQYGMFSLWTTILEKN